MKNNDGRRPLKVRASRHIQAVAIWLCKKNITPNSISILSIIFSAFSAACLFTLPYASGSSKWALPVMAAVFIQLRLLCNLFDGMVAVEGGKGTPAGELFNDMPDRIADSLILVAAGYATTIIDYSNTLGWCAALLAVTTAYVRTLSKSIGAPADFRGPMAKQHRMALMTAACLITALEPIWTTQGYILLIALIIIIFGSALTIYNRARAAYLFLEQPKNV